jgi:L-threonylcarbamoyladenylate synthase
VLVEGALADLPERLSSAAELHPKARLGLMLPDELAGSMAEAPLHNAVFFAWGRWSSPGELAERLYAGLRALDSEGCEVILCPVPGDAGIGAAIRDRLRKAAAT